MAKKPPDLEDRDVARDLAKDALLGSLDQLDPAQGRGLQQAIAAGILSLLSGGGTGGTAVNLTPLVEAIERLERTARLQLDALKALDVNVQALAKVGLPKP